MKPGKIIIAHDVNVWPHEMETARALAAAGRDVEFIRKIEIDHATSADIYLDGIAWEMKAPRSDNLKAVQRNLHKALHQSHYVIFDSRRMRRVPDSAVERELRTLAPKFKNLRRLVLVNRHGEVIDIV